MRIALAASARDWSDRLHRSILDHGGGRVVGRVMSSDQAIDLAFDVLFIDDICSFLTPRLVFDLRTAGRSLVGVFSPEDGSDGKRRLLEAGISDVIEADATYEEFLVVARSSIAALPEMMPTPQAATHETGMIVGVIGPPGGVGVTEIAVGVSLEIARRQLTVLVDLNQTWPAIGQRLNLPVHPNLRTAVDYSLHEPDRLEKAVHASAALDVITGLANPAAGELPASDVATLITSLSQRYSRTVIDLGSVASRPNPLLLQRMDALLVVGLCDPIGLTRLVRTLDALREIVDEANLAVALNRGPRSARQRQEVRGQVRSLLPTVPAFIVGEDPRLARASWNGESIGRGGFQKHMARLGTLLGEDQP